MNEAEKILAKIAELAERMQNMENAGTEERQNVLAQVEKLQTELDDVRQAGVIAASDTGTNTTKVEQRNALNIYLRGNELDEENTRSLSSIKDSDGGFLLKETLEADVIMNAFNPGEVESVVPVLPTGGNRALIASMQKPKVAWGAKNLTLSDQDLGSGIVAVDIHSIRALVVIPNDTLEDAAADIVGELNSAFGSALEEARDDAYTIGSGVNMPQGFSVNKQVRNRAVESETVGKLGVDDIIAAIYKLKKTYRRNAVIACNSQTEGKMAAFKGSDGQPLWRVGAETGAPSTFMKLPIINPESMDDVAAGNYPLIVADLASGYRIRERGSVTIQRLDEAFATADQTAFLIKQRIGAQTALPEAFVPVKIKA